MSAPTAATLADLGRLATRMAVEGYDADDAADLLIVVVNGDTDQRRVDQLAALARVGAGALVAAVRAESGAGRS